MYLPICLLFPFFIKNYLLQGYQLQVSAINRVEQVNE